jgi:hypothetical protein
MTQPKSNLPASIHRRLLDGARQRGEDFQLTLLRFGAERLLYRLGRSAHAREFVLKGAMLFLLWSDQLYRPTRDVDLLGFGDPTPDRLRRIFVEICSQECPEDALQFDPATVTADPIRTIQDYGGVRVTVVAMLGKARIALQIDIGFGDAITPAPRDATFPTLLPLDPPKVRAYPLETVVAEKFDAVVRLGRANSRMKDFHDLCTLAARCDFDGGLLTKAVRATFTRRKADLSLIPDALSPDFYDDATLGQRWRAFVKGKPIANQPEMTFSAVGEQLRAFLGPLGEALAGNVELVGWSRSTGWTARALD